MQTKTTTRLIRGMLVLASLLLLNTVAFADTNADAATGDNQGQGEVNMSNVKVNSGSGAWEISFYCQNSFKGFFLVLLVPTCHFTPLV